jgi:hypothetical protein
MRRVLMMSMLFGALAATVGGAGCARQQSAGVDSRPAGAQAGAATTGTPEPGRSARTRESQIYVQVLKRYLTSGDSSFAEQSLGMIYLLDRTQADAADPMVAPESSDGVRIPADVQRQIAEALPNVTIIADRASVIVDHDGCRQVRDGGILITLGPVIGDDVEARVGINGFVACLGATWLTYVVHHDAGTGWQVSGTTGPRAIA